MCNYKVCFRQRENYRISSEFRNEPNRTQSNKLDFITAIELFRINLIIFLFFVSVLALQGQRN